MKEMVLMGALRNSQSSALSKRPNEHCPIRASFCKTRHFAEVLATFMFTNLAENKRFFIFILEVIITQKA